ncbi:hypothetical protein VIGAN_08367900 [Vigna angularis var. angularis]|uniref:Uncharacterized protein n=1 Tax=Vigna angularis var. angularis TaxID=157739 RepID=A0A0S3SVA0_PHAAN|nr:hypothetical protein VIGAN_08367900 [Vigna angularis var. angularis]
MGHPGVTFQRVSRPGATERGRRARLLLMTASPFPLSQMLQPFSTQRDLGRSALTVSRRSTLPCSRPHPIIGRSASTNNWPLGLSVLQAARPQQIIGRSASAYYWPLGLNI